MELIPFVGETPLTASSVVVRVDSRDRQRALDLVKRTKSLFAVANDGDFQIAKRLAGEAKAMLDEMEISKKAAKQPFRQVAAAIDQLVVEVGTPVANEHARILSLLNGYVADLERKAKEAERKRLEAEQIKQEAMNRKLQEAAEKLATAEQEAREAKDEAARLLAQKNAAERQAALLQAQIEQDMAAEVASMFPLKPAPGLVPGGRVNHPYKFELANIHACIQTPGGMRLLKWSLDIRACQDAVRAQLEASPHVEPFLPGIKISREISVSVKASARTE